MPNRADGSRRSVMIARRQRWRLLAAWHFRLLRNGALFIELGVCPGEEAMMTLLHPG